MMIVRHLLSILILPFTVVFVVPRWILAGQRAGSDGHFLNANVAYILGSLVFATGFALFSWCLVLFVTEGKGTLAPWDPTKRIVARGPYQYTRNPMIIGVLTMLVGESIFFRSSALAGWVATFLIMNQVYFLLLEEPGLERRFGEDYLRYKRAVPRWIPRLRG
jgi:protein-S-isoprenylcysteine O-methyltransferase Ste14